MKQISRLAGAVAAVVSAFLALAVGSLVAAITDVVSPLDVIPDVLPVIGEIDDLAIVLLGIKTFLRLCPAAVTAFHREAIAQGRAFSPMTPRDAVLDAEFRPGP